MHFNVGHNIRLESDLVSIKANSTIPQLSVLQEIIAKTTWIRGKFKQTTIYTSLVFFLSLCFQTSVFNTALSHVTKMGRAPQQRRRILTISVQKNMVMWPTDLAFQRTRERRSPRNVSCRFFRSQIKHSKNMNPEKQILTAQAQSDFLWASIRAISEEA